jgi:hypothetical protein
MRSRRSKQLFDARSGNLWIAEAVAREMPQVSLEDALKLVHLYAEKESPKYEAAAMKWLRRYLDERSPELAGRREGRRWPRQPTRGLKANTSGRALEAL